MTASSDTSMGMSEHVVLCQLSDLSDLAGTRIERPGYPPLAVFLLDGDVHVVDDTCTHGDASLCEGEFDGDEIECPWHGGRFCVRDGSATSTPALLPLRVYRVAIEGDSVLLLTPPP